MEKIIFKILINLGGIYYNLGQLEKARILYERCLNIQNNYYGEGYV